LLDPAKLLPSWEKASSNPRVWRGLTIIGTALSRFRVSWSTGYGIRQPLRHLGAVHLQARLPHIRF
ncbi:MAG: hypothetical protein WBX00_34090, partial [Isosphaeraceae bacterium]